MAKDVTFEDLVVLVVLSKSNCTVFDVVLAAVEVAAPLTFEADVIE